MKKLINFFKGNYNGIIEEEPIYGYMCKIDFDYEIGDALGGSTIYSSVADLKKHHDLGCGIVKVRVEFEELVEQEDINSWKDSNE